MKAKPLNAIHLNVLFSATANPAAQAEAGHENSAEMASEAHVASSRDFVSLYNEHKRWVRTVIFQIIGSRAGSEVLDDLVQEAFVRIWRGLASFREDSKLSSWIYRIGVNTALDHLRSQGRQRESFNDAAIEKAEASDAQDRTMESRDLVSKGLQALSADHRTVLVLAVIHEIPLTEVAEILGISLGTVKSRLHYAKSEFRKFMALEGVEI